MFENLTPREKKLAFGVVALLPIALVFVVFLWISGNLTEKQQTIDTLDEQYTVLLQKQLAAMEASARRAVYREESLSPDINTAKTDYGEWLFNLATHVFGRNPKLNSLGAGEKYHYFNKVEEERELVFTNFSYSIVQEGTIGQLTEFLFDFHRAKILHRIRALTIRPRITGQGSKQFRGDQLRIDMTIDVACMSDANLVRDFADDIRTDFPRTLEEYKAMVAHRNLFGPPNNPPEFQVVTNKTAITNKGTSFNLVADDPDKDDQLTIELISSPVSGAKLVQGDGRMAKFEFPGQPRGTYKFKALVSDNGCPAKTDEVEYRVVVSDPKPSKPTAKVEKPKHAPLTYVKAFTTNVRQEKEVWIHFRAEGVYRQLIKGDSFDLDGKKWTIISVADPNVIIEVDGDRLLFRQGTKLSDPVKKLSMAETPVAKGGGTPGHK